jgi:anaerobic magnesium-protoporphyrin IX monomethyl ester cyclase
MNPHPVTFVAFKEFDNLGIGYISSVLSKAGYESTIIDFSAGKKSILDTIRRINPSIVGFSIIFQYYICEFQELISYLRNEGIKCHFTGGGHYASLRYKELFELIPSLDSVVRFEGEYTFLDLVNCISTSKEWKDIPGIAYKINTKIITNPLRKVETALDNFPYPIRSPLREYVPGKKFATILAGRGCIYNCSFCSVNEYYKESSAPAKRLRIPGKVVEEMALLNSEEDCRVFLFQDDDFPVNTHRGAEWIESFCEELRRINLHEKILWKINCRPDEVDIISFAMMKDHGLYLVFLGIEDGTDAGLTRLNKHSTLARTLEGIGILKKLEIDFDYGFMPFQPSSTFSSIKDNFLFLSEICGDGFSPFTFLKMMPFCETAIERELKRDGRLKGKPGFPDYDFHDESLNHLFEFTDNCFLEWLRTPYGLVNMSKLARNYISVYSRFFGLAGELRTLKMEVRDIISESNTFFFNIMMELIGIFESGNYNRKYDDLMSFRKRTNLKHDQLKERLRITMSRLMIMMEFHKQSSAYIF